MSITEAPVSFQIAAGCSLLGALLRRNVWYNQVRFRVYPNMSSLLVGPSGIGKDTTINAAMGVLNKVAPTLQVEGRTIERLYDRLIGQGDPACAAVPAQEVSAFFGQKDYQKGMVQEITDLLSTGDYKDVSTKANPGARILHPTVTMFSGSTVEWIHRAMPEGSMEGGFWPRFLIVCEEYPARKVASVSHSNTVAELATSEHSSRALLNQLTATAERFRHYPHGVVFLEDAYYVYNNWYHNRDKIFSEAVRPYAHRGRDQFLRLALLCAVSRGNDFIDVPDVVFAREVMKTVAGQIDKVLIAPTVEAQAAKEILKLLPAGMEQVTEIMTRKYPRRILRDAMANLLESGQAKVENRRLVRVV